MLGNHNLLSLYMCVSWLLLMTGRGAVKRMMQQIRYCVLSSMKRRIQNSDRDCADPLHPGTHAKSTNAYDSIADMKAASYPGRFTKRVATEATGTETVARNHSP